MIKSNLLIILTVCVAITGIFAGEHFKLYDSEHVHSPLREPLPKDAMDVEINVLESNVIQRIGLFQEILIKVKNLSNTTWPSGRHYDNNNYGIYITYDWISKSGQLLVEKPVITPLPFDIGPREEAYATVRVSGIDLRGEYVLKLYMVQEGVGKFKVSNSSHNTINCRLGNYGL